MSVRLNKYPKYDVFIFDRVADTMQITGHWNIYHSDLQKYEVTRSVKLNKYPIFDAYLLDGYKRYKAKSLDYVM